MQKIYDFCLSVILILILFLLIMSGLRRQDENLASRIAPEILRFHVLANSDSPEDQALKLEVKDLLLETIRTGLTAEVSEAQSVGDTAAETTTSAAYEISRDQVIRYVTDHRGELEQTATSYMEERGYDYPANIRFEQCYFPEKTYGDMTFPAGTYDAVRVLIGEGKGQNFWCVLYPSLCYMDSTYAVVPDSSKETLKALLPEDDFQALLAARHPGPDNNQKTEQKSSLPRLKIRFKLLEYIGQSCESQE